LPVPPPPPRTPSPWREWLKWPPGRRGWVVSGAVVLAVIALVLGLTLPGSGGPPPLHTGTPTVTTLAVPGHGQVSYAQLSPDGKLLIADGITTDIYVWNATTGAYLSTLHAPANSLTNWFAFSPDDTSVVGVSDVETPSTDTTVAETMYSWNVATGARTKLHSLPVNANWVLSGDDSTLAQESGDTVTVTDLATGAVTARLKVPGAPADPGLDISVDQTGDRILVASKNGTAYVWNVAENQVIQHVSYPDRKNDGLITDFPRLSWDGRTIVVFANDNNKGPSSLWDVATGANITPHDSRWPKDDEGCLFSEDSRVCATDTSNGVTIDLWDIATHKLLLAVTDPKGAVGGGATDIGPDAGQVVGLGPVNSDFYATTLYLWTIP